MKREDWRDTGAGVAVGTAAAIESAQSYADKRFPRVMGFSGLGGGGACDGHYSSHVIVCHPCTLDLGRRPWRRSRIAPTLTLVVRA